MVCIQTNNIYEEVILLRRYVCPYDSHEPCIIHKLFVKTYSPSYSPFRTRSTTRMLPFVLSHRSLNMKYRTTGYLHYLWFIIVFVTKLMITLYTMSPYRVRLYFHLIDSQDFASFPTSLFHIDPPEETPPPWSPL